MELEKIWRGWKVDKFLGQGSFGKVYKIVREDFGHTYEAAMKVIEIPQNQSEVEMAMNDGMTGESVTEYFKSMVEDIVEEFTVMSKLKGNSNIVSYEDHEVVRKEDGFGWEIYIRMELLTPLFKYLEDNPLKVKDVIQLGIDMCKALESCQQCNIIHRDIKPENIFVSSMGTFKLGDFGIARQLEKTSSGLSKKGTYTYMAPEVYKGLSYNSTVDIYSLGIVLYRFLNNNRTPFMPPAPQLIRYSDKETANVLRLSGKEMPSPCNADGRLAEIVLKACAYNPKERYESPYAMRQELQTVLYSAEERPLAYPKGDILSNDKNEYVTDNISISHNEEDKTSYLFHSEEDEAKQKKEKVYAKEEKKQENQRLYSEEKEAQKKETEKEQQEKIKQQEGVQITNEKLSNKNQTNQLSMKWFKFIIYVQLFLNMLLNLGNAGNLISGNIYDQQGVSASTVYSVYPNLSIIDKLCGVMYLVLAVVAIYVRQRLTKYKKDGPKLYLIFIIAQVVAVVIYNVAVYIVAQTGDESTVIGQIWMLGILFAGNKIYFDKRKDMFVN